MHIVPQRHYTPKVVASRRSTQQRTSKSSNRDHVFDEWSTISWNSLGGPGVMNPNLFSLASALDSQDHFLVSTSSSSPQIESTTNSPRRGGGISTHVANLPLQGGGCRSREAEYPSADNDDSIREVLWHHEGSFGIVFIKISRRSQINLRERRPCSIYKYSMTDTELMSE